MAGRQKPLQSGIFLLELLNTGKIEAKGLTTHQRRIIVRHLMDERTHTSYEISELLGVHEVTIRRDIQKIKEQNSWMLDEVDERSIVLDLIETVELAQVKLFKKERYKDAWTVLREFVETLLHLGYIKQKQPDRNGNPTLAEFLKYANEVRSETNNGVNDGKAPNI